MTPLAATRLMFLETNVIERYFTEDVPEKIEGARRVVEQEPGLALAPVTLAETAYVLTRPYGVPREVVVDPLWRWCSDGTSRYAGSIRAR
ncbi:hypothetical protein NET02_00330 [Thermomicrobiaceae bacterium CFH 74404]|uniref:PIN domain-containing protein n=1 Tax=Thermalbibacter longus TaxID=2951981 RepID=A0AA42B9R2_9BACT|nr:hypothetical protein [Thermalbibacter longus]MCM8747584.1 hypothetical protein [Thermalbibacter longus]